LVLGLIGSNRLVGLPLSLDVESVGLEGGLLGLLDVDDPTLRLNVFYRRGLTISP
jgi:hypothetical protein